MTKQLINIGTSANKGNGDPLRTAFNKINENFSELYTQLDGFGLNNSIPSLTGNDGKYLSNDGAALVWHTLTIPTDINQLADSSHLLPSPDLVASVGTTPPGVHPTGTLWYDSTSGRLYVYFDSSWIDASPKGTASAITYATKAANATGVAGQISYDANWIYICTSTNTWKRSPLTGAY
jgi:hypothetical protein